MIAMTTVEEAAKFAAVNHATVPTSPVEAAAATWIGSSSSLDAFLMNSMKLSALMPKRMPDSAERSVS